MTASSAFLVLAVELDTGTLFLAERGGALGFDALTPAVLSFGAAGKGGASLSLEAQALPDYIAEEYWSNREAMLLEAEPGAGSVYDGRIVFDGVVSAEPSEQAGVLSLNLIPRRNNVVMLPDYGVIDAATYPLAPAESQGACKPLIFGAVEDCPLLPAALPASTTLSVAASAQDAQLEVADATPLAASGSVVVDGRTYTYSAKSGNILLGVAVAAYHRAGTMVAQAGSAVFLAAGHALSALSAIKAAGQSGKTLLEGAAVDLSAATATFASLPGVAVSGERMNVALQFDAVGAGNTALNAGNAIRYATVQASANATALPGAVYANSDPLTSVITFARPAERIVRGIYTVAFTVSIGQQVGWARVKIGGDVVWQMEAPSSVIYNYTPATILLDTDVDVLPVAVEVERGGSVDQVGVTVASASRVVYTGNLDDANYATLRQASNTLFRADQTTANPDLGPIAKAQLVVRWFAGKSGMGAPTVKFAGRTLGVLAQTQLSNNTLSQNVTVDVTNQGLAALPQQNISTTITGGTASLSHTAIAQTAVISSILVPVNGAAWVQRGWSKCPKFQGLQGSITARVTFVSDTAGNAAASFIAVHFRNASGSDIAYLDNSYTLTNVATNTWEATVTMSAAPDHIFCERALTNVVELSAVVFEWNATIASATVTQNNTPAGGSSQPIGAQDLSHSGTAVSVSGGNINFTVPAPPRVVNTVFDLAEYTDWAQFTNQQVEISYAGGSGVDLCLVQVYLSVEYDAITYAAAGTPAAPLTASVTGLSGNPADVLTFLHNAIGSAGRVNAEAEARLAAWCTANSYTFARRIADKTDALTLLQFAAEQCCVELCDTPDGLVMVRWFDLAETPTVIDPRDLLNAANIGWADRVENEITLNYRADYSGQSGNGFARALVADAANNSDCRKGLAAIKEARGITLDGGWIRSDATAARYLADYAKRHARPRRAPALQLPFTYSALVRGGLVEHGDMCARITELNDDNGWSDVRAEEILL